MEGIDVQLVHWLGAFARYTKWFQFEDITGRVFLIFVHVGAQWLSNIATERQVISLQFNLDKHIKFILDNIECNLSTSGGIQTVARFVYQRALFLFVFSPGNDLGFV